MVLKASQGPGALPGGPEVARAAQRPGRGARQAAGAATESPQHPSPGTSRGRVPVASAPRLPPGPFKLTGALNARAPGGQPGPFRLLFKGRLLARASPTARIRVPARAPGIAGHAARNLQGYMTSERTVRSLYVSRCFCRDGRRNDASRPGPHGGGLPMAYARKPRERRCGMSRMPRPSNTCKVARCSRAAPGGVADWIANRRAAPLQRANPSKEARPWPMRAWARSTSGGNRPAECAHKGMV